MPQAQRSIVIDISPEKLFDVIVDYAKYPEFMPEVKKIEVGPLKGNTREVTYKISLIKEITYTLKMVEERPSKISWNLVKGELFKLNTGNWLLEPAGENKTKATYTIEVGLGALVPKAITTAIAESNLPKMLEGMKKRAELVAK